MTDFEFLVEGDAARYSDAHQVVWPTGRGESPTMRSDIGAWLRELGPVPDEAIDLVRIAVAAYIADRLSRRGVGFTRTIDLAVHVLNPDAWVDTASDVADLLFWLTGDDWHFELLEDGAERPAVEDGDPIDEFDVVALLSGGLDSLCGAALEGVDDRLYLGHWDNPTVKGAQNATAAWLAGAFDDHLNYRQLRVVQLDQKREASSRSRSFLFMALAVAQAAAVGATRIEIPENGFTSLNPPLGPERGGALSTRSTHPATISRFNQLVGDIGLRQVAVVPYMEHTKGQLVARAAAEGPDTFDAGLAVTLSCGKLDGARYKGGNPNFHCGLCFPCIVRRAAVLAAGVTDKTPYLSQRLKGKALKRLRANRSSDVEAIGRALEVGFNDEQLIAMGPFPTEFDLDVAFSVCEEGFKELGMVDLG